jgi:hypothetical protein
MRIKDYIRKKSLDDKDRKVLVENVEENPMISAENPTTLLAGKTRKIATDRTIQNELNGEGLASRASRKLYSLSKKILMIGLIR